MKYIADGNYFNIVEVEDTQSYFFKISDENIFVSSTLCLQSRIRSKQRYRIIRRILFLSPRIHKG